MEVDKTIQSAQKNIQAGNLQQAEYLLKRVLNLQPNNITAINLLGIISYQFRNYSSAIQFMRKLINLDPNHSQAHYILGHSLQEKGETDEAISHYQKSLQLNPNLVDAYYNLGTIFQDRKRYDEAIACYQKVLQFNSTDIDANYNTGLALQEKGHFEQAINFFKKVLQLNPNCDEAYGKIGFTLQEMRQAEEAINFYRKAIELNPNNLTALYGLGTALEEKGQLDEAVTYYQKAMQLNPNHAQVYSNIAAILQEKGQLDEAKSYCERALQLDSKCYKAYHNLGVIFTAQGKLDEAEKYYEHALKLKPDELITHQSLVSMTNYNSNYNAQKIFLKHLEFAKQFAEPLFSAILPHTNDSSPSRRLKIGYVSPDFRKHSVSYFIEPTLAWHNREYFEVFCYSNSKRYDEVTRSIQEYADQWRNIKGVQDEKVAELIRKDGIDILVDLAGHTRDNRILLFAYKPAPVQVTWIGYPSTTGLSTIDYKIVDNYTDPPGITEQFYTEKLIRLPESFLCYLPDHDSPDIGNLPALTSRHITFGSFNNFTKISCEIARLWVKILEAVPDSNLLIKTQSFSDRVTRDYAAEMFMQEGIDSDRLKLLSWDPSTRSHLRKYNLIDIGLDTFPYNGTTTTCEALWMGVPVVTLCGNTPASRAGVSLLSNVGFPELVAKTTHEYVSIAVDLANDLKKLQSFRAGLRNMMMCSPLCDAKRFTLNLEMCYQTMWETWCKSV